MEDLIDELKEVLEFYSDPLENRRWTCVGCHDRCGTPGEDCPYCETDPVPDFYQELDFGQKARIFLCEIEKFRDLVKERDDLSSRISDYIKTYSEMHSEIEELADKNKMLESELDHLQYEFYYGD